MKLPLLLSPGPERLDASALANAWSALTEADGMLDLTAPEDYEAPEDAVEAINLAIQLDQPLLITGDPGCGKTEFANWAAWKLRLSVDPEGEPLVGRRPEHALRFNVKSTTEARDLFYHLDAVERFHATQTAVAEGLFGDQLRTAVDASKFIRYRAFGRAILRALPEKDKSSSKVSAREKAGFDEQPGQQARSVVLLDEIDKAPVETPNDLLDEIENLRFTVPELDNQVFAAPRGWRPIVIMTSNETKALPDPFLRRCLYYHMERPAGDALRRILAKRLKGPDLDDRSPLIRDAAKLHDDLAKERGQYERTPGTSELLGFVLALRARGARGEDAVTSIPGWRQAAFATLAKSDSDHKSLAGVMDKLAPASVSA